MSGHSHWQNIRAKKSAEDARKSKLFSKYSKLISVAAREGGGDPEQNFKLRDAIDRAKEVDMPQDTIERAVKRGTGEIEGVEYKEVAFEAYGPGGAALIIDGITDNRNRTVGELKNLVEKHGGKLAEPGGVKYQFERKGNIALNLEDQPDRFKVRDELELAAIDAGAEDVSWEGDFLDIYVDLSDLEKTKEALKKKGIVIEAAVPGWKPKTEIELPAEDRKEVEKLFADLGDHDDVQEIYSNIK